MTTREINWNELIKNIAKKCKRKYYTADVQDEDLVQEGFLALEKAKRHYKPTTTVLFSTYAYKAIQSNIYRFMHKNSNKLPIVQEEIFLDNIPGKSVVLWHDITDAINRLDCTEKDLITDYFYNNMTYHALGEKYGKSHNAMFLKVKNILSKLKRELKSYESH